MTCYGLNQSEKRNYYLFSTELSWIIIKLPEILRLVAQCQKKLRHRVLPVISRFLALTPHITQQPLVDQDLLKFEASKSHSIWHITLDRAPLAELPARRKELYLTTHNIYKRHTFINAAVIEPAILASQRSQTQAISREATDIGLYYTESMIIGIY
jgi:hypothetical protein